MNAFVLRNIFYRRIIESGGFYEKKGFNHIANIFVGVYHIH